MRTGEHRHASHEVTHVTHGAPHVHAMQRSGPPSGSGGGFLCCFSPPQGGQDPTSSFDDLSPAAGLKQGTEMTSTSGRDAVGRWQIIWNKDQVAQRLVFEASSAT